MRVHEWVYECALDAASLTRQRLRIQVFDDGTMTGAVEDAPLQPDAPLPRDFGRPSGFQYYVMDGSATWRDVDGDAGDLRCRCQFKLMRFSKRLRQGQLMACEAELLPASHNDSASGSSLRIVASSVRRCIRAYSQDLALPAFYQLRLLEQLVMPSIEPLMWRMTPGTYVFKGFTCAVSEMLYECKITLQLSEDGSLTGVSEDLIHSFTRKSRLQGYWSADGVTFRLVDTSGDLPHVFVYSLAPHPSGLRGSWHEQVTNKRGYFQEGHVELAVASVQRHGTWTPSRHDAYPVEFQAAAQECLNARSDRPLLPQDLWDCVLSNCTYDWF